MKKIIIGITALIGIVLVIFGISAKMKNSAAIAIIGGADGPTSIYLAGTLGNSLGYGLLATGIIILLIIVVIYKKHKK